MKHSKPTSLSARAAIPRIGRPPVEVNSSAIRELFGIPQPIAAKMLGISLTSLKQVCRKIGVLRWPYRRGENRSKACAGPSSNCTDGPPHIDSTSNHFSVQSPDVVNDWEQSDHESLLSRTSSTSSDAVSLSNAPVSMTFARSHGRCYVPPSKTMHEGGCTRIISQKCCESCDSKLESFEEDDDDEDDDDLVWKRLLDIGGEWADHYARDATRQLDECLCGSVVCW